MVCPSIARLHICQQYQHLRNVDTGIIRNSTSCARSRLTGIDRRGAPSRESPCAAFHRSSNTFLAVSSTDRSRASTRIPSGISTSNATKSKQTIKANVERAAKILNEVLEEVMSAMFVAEAAAYIQSANVDLVQADAVRNAVISRIDLLDANFLASLNGYVSAARERGDVQLSDLLVAVADEVLRQVSLRLPDAARVLDLALKQMDKDSRVAVLKTALDGGAGEVPAAEVDGLLATSSQFIDDMEEGEVVADRALLARMCLLREELRWVEMERSFGGDSAASSAAKRANVPQRCVAFMKELMVVNDSLKRVGLLDRAFAEDWDGAAPQKKSSGTGTAAATGNVKPVPDYVRPGRFLATLHATKEELQLDATKHALVLQRLEAILMESVAVLDRLQRGPGPAKEASQAQPTPS